MDVYWAKEFPDSLYILVGENDLRLIDKNGREYLTRWFKHSCWFVMQENYGFQLIGTIEPEGEF